MIQVHYMAGTEQLQHPMVKHPYKVHVWSAFSMRDTVSFHMFTENMNGELYCQILANNLANIQTVMGRGWVFQQDNNPKHMVKVTKQFLTDSCVRVLDWLLNLPDLNPIENLWVILKKRVEKKVNKKMQEKKSIMSAEF